MKPSKNQIAIDRIRSIESALKDWEISIGWIRKNLAKSRKDYEQAVIDFEGIAEEDLR
jgi:hypothetical protein